MGDFGQTISLAEIPTPRVKYTGDLGNSGNSKNRPNPQAVFEFYRLSRNIYPTIGGYPILLWRSQVALLVDTRSVGDGGGF